VPTGEFGSLSLPPQLVLRSGTSPFPAASWCVSSFLSSFRRVMDAFSLSLGGCNRKKRFVVRFSGPESFGLLAGLFRFRQVDCGFLLISGRAPLCLERNPPLTRLSFSSGQLSSLLFSPLLCVRVYSPGSDNAARFSQLTVFPKGRDLLPRTIMSSPRFPSPLPL